MGDPYLQEARMPECIPCFPELTSAALQEPVPFSPVLFQKRSGSYTAVQPSLSLPPPLDLPDQGNLFVPCLISSSFCFSLQQGGVLPRGSTSRYPSVANYGSCVLLGFCVQGRYTCGMGKEEQKELRSLESSSDGPCASSKCEVRQGK